MILMVLAWLSYSVYQIFFAESKQACLFWLMSE